MIKSFVVKYQHKYTTLYVFLIIIWFLFIYVSKLQMSASLVDAVETQWCKTMQIIQKFSNMRERMQVMGEVDKHSLVIDLIDHLLCRLIDDAQDFNKEDTFFSMGMDSMLLIQFKIFMEKHLEYKIPTEVFYTHDTINKLSLYIENTLS
jgi:acyl carrier protein